MPHEPDGVIYINGRFTAQRLSGVQRFAVEISRSLSELYPDRVRILAPKNTSAHAREAQIVGGRTGHVWEQYDLPKYAKGGMLLNLGNTAPILAHRQIVVIHDAGVFRTPEAYSAPFRLWYKFLHAAFAKTGTPIVTVSQFSKSELIDNLHILPSRIRVVPEGADHMSGIAPDDTVISRNGLAPRAFVLAVGNLAAHKNLSALGDLANRLAARNMVLAVTGAAGGAAYSGAGSNGLPETARYLGRVSDAELKSLYSHAACFVFPSRYEGFGLPAIEAMACGCPVAAADIRALRETCGDAALYFNPHSPIDISSAVLTLLDDPALSEQLRRAAHRHIADMTWAKAASRLAEIIGEAA